MLAGVVLLGCVGAAAAQSQPRPDLAGLTEASHIIVRARCIGQQSRLEGRVFTYVRLQVIEAIKGTPPAEFEVRVPGGIVPIPGGPAGSVLVSTVPHAPRFEAGVESVFFLWAGPTGQAPIPQLVGLSLGKIDVAADGTVVEPSARRLPLQLAPPPGGLSAGRVPATIGGRMPVSELVARIRTHVSGGK